jgi:hypothetical protein
VSFYEAAVEIKPFVSSIPFERDPVSLLFALVVAIVVAGAW